MTETFNVTAWSGGKKEGKCVHAETLLEPVD
jgi:hypothetical protein